MPTYYKPQSPIQSGEDFIYPITTADQVMVDGDTRLNAVGVYLENIDYSTDTTVYGNNATTLGGVAAEDYALKTDTAPNSNKLGGKSPEYYLQPRNLLDNTDFRNPVNQRGQTSYSIAGYTIDRWRINVNTGTLSICSGYIRLEDAKTNNNHLRQHIDRTFAEDTTVTFAIKARGINFGICYFGVNASKFSSEDWTVITYTYTIPAGTNLAASENYNPLITWSKAGYTELAWAALYEGSYTADTLPPYVPKGYAQELAECQMYLRPFVNAISGRAYELHAIMVEMPLSPPMRKDGLMTVTFNNGEAMYSTAYTVDGAKQVVTSFQSECNEHVARYVFYCADELSVGTPNVLTGLNGWISKEL